jgi:diguanylate cyclase (GGDEF)-like protein
MNTPAPIRVLHVEDSPFDRDLVRDALEHAETAFALTSARNRKEFEAALQAGSFDCVLTDFNILGYTGLQVFDAVRTVRPALPVVILTGTGSEELAVAAMKRGVADYILKTPQHILRLPLTLRHIVEQAALTVRLDHLVTHDALTDLPNRTLLIDRLGQALSNAVRFGRSLALLTIDLVRFRGINENFGHAAGDQVLVEVGRRLAGLVRSGDTVARSGADEFSVILANLDEENDAIILAQRILDRIAEPLAIGARQLSLNACLGIGLYPKDATDSDALFKAADIALDRARQAGKNCFRFFTPEMNEDAALRLRLESDLRQAVEQEALELLYQPQINLINGRICGYEALLRWHHPELGPVSPARFIPLAEEIGLIDRIGAWAIRTACRQNKTWTDAGLPLLPMAVNVSPRQFRHSDLVGIVTQALDDAALPGAGLELEITESALIEHLDQVAHVVTRLKSLGVLLALDDFGTGYSSLSHLSRLPFDKIKIDQAFIRDITTNPINAAIVNATIAMGRSLNMTVLAEGVETEAQLLFLRNRQCEAMQGWLFSKALDPDQLGALIRSGDTLKVGAGETAAETLLIVDDEQNIINALRRLLRRENYQIIATTSPRDAFDLLARHRVQVIVSDQRMPEMSGTEFLSRVKQLYPDTVRIVLSGYTDLESVTDAINRGAIYRYLVKPWDDEALRAHIREAFRVAHGAAHV